jgi:ABC-2 type transport system ATP-binding protein
MSQDKSLEDVAVKVSNVSKTFKLPHEKTTSIKSAAVNFYKRKKTYEKQKVLDDVSFSIGKGEFFGIVGRNGSGKSTMLKLLAGIYTPTNGDIQIIGKLTPFIELGVGFNPELTGRENVYLNGALLGFSRKEMQAMYNDIVEFAELEKFMDQKLKNYSSGMQVRLAFSIAIRAQSDVLLIDEVLAVGDAAFQQKCYEYFRKLKNDKKTVVFVSHDRGAVENFCDKCLLMDNGKIIAIGSPSKVLNEYNEITLEQMAGGSKKKAGTGRWGSGDIEITGATVINKSKSNKFFPGEVIRFKVDMKVNKLSTNPVFGITVKRESGNAVLTTNTKAEKIETGEFKPGEKLSIVYEIDNIFGNGRYKISPAVANENTNVFFDWREGLVEFFVSGWDDTYADIHPPHRIKMERQK